MIYVEPGAPTLRQWDEFVEWCDERRLSVYRTYTPPLDIDGEQLGGYWSTVMAAEVIEWSDERRIFTFNMALRDGMIEDGHPQMWGLLAEMVGRGLADVVAAAA